jgi:predicted nuclease of predicted toxin-antitoxin system
LAAAAIDSRLLDVAQSEKRVIISGDRDFAALLTELRLDQPSVIYLRSGIPLHPKPLAALIHANLPAIEGDLKEGSIVVFEPSRIRVRRLPIAD